VVTATDKRRAMLIDLLIGLGIPILQIIVAYVVSGRRYVIFEDFGPYIFIVNTPPAYFLFSAWPLAIGCVSFVYSSMTIYILYKRSRQFRQLLSFGQGINRGRYFRLMVLASVDAFGSIPLATYVIVLDAKSRVVPWKSWAYTHRHYSDIMQIPASEWRKGPEGVGLEMFRWLIVSCAFVFFAFFGFGDEAFKHYRLAYTSIARRIGYSKSSGTLHDSSHGTSGLAFSRTKNRGGIAISWSTTPTTQRDTPVASTDKFSIKSTDLVADLERNFKTEQDPPSDSPDLKSEVGLEPGLESRLHRPETIILAADPESVLAGQLNAGPSVSIDVADSV